ncbi:MAG: hypothetical protein A2X86_01755 [Bdellovibrionales bacterium GWA2_49_15]|nr:MAG: hypothetical protein A2X86_01755 [Bdellovibrionales bacterium GWA2_49_15]
MRFTQIRKLILITCALCITACNFLNDKQPEEGQTFDIGNFATQCKLDMHRFKYFLDQSLKSEMDCLKKNLDAYVSFVSRQDANYIQLKELLRFVEKFHPKDLAMGQKVLVFLLKISAVLFGDTEERIHIRSLEKMFQLFHILNRDGILLKYEIKRLTKENYLSRRSRLASMLGNVSENFLALLSDSPTTKVQLDIMALAQETQGIFQERLIGLDLEFLRSVLFVKKIFLGGDPAFLSLENIRDFLKKAPLMTVSVFDFILSDAEGIWENSDTQYQYLSAFKNLRQLQHLNFPSETILTHRELMALLTHLIGDKYNVAKFEEALIQFKQRMVGGDADDYNQQDLNAVFDMAREVLETLFFNSVTYEHFRGLLEQPNAIHDLERPNLPQYEIISMSRILKYWSTFHHMLTRYRFFTDRSARQIYGDFYDRHLAGVNRMAIMRLIFTRMIRAYGFQNSDSESERYPFLLDKKRLRQFMYQYQGFLYESKLLNADLERTINEISMGSDLFQAHSDDDFAMNEDEMTEYIAMILASNKMGKQVMEQLSTKCYLLPGRSGGFDLPCYRENFYKVLFDDLQLSRYFPKLYAYYLSTSTTESFHHLLNLEGNSRILDDDKLPMTATDINRLLTAFSQAESMLIRFDKNRNNFLDSTEIDSGYLHFKNIIAVLSKIGPDQDGVVKSIFLFLLKHKKIPKKSELLMFHIFGQKKGITASRFVIGLVLANIINR